MIEFLQRVRDPVRPRPIRPRPIDVVFAGEAPLARACALVVRRMSSHSNSSGLKTLSASDGRFWPSAATATTWANAGSPHLLAAHSRMLSSSAFLRAAKQGYDPQVAASADRLLPVDAGLQIATPQASVRVSDRRVDPRRPRYNRRRPCLTERQPLTSEARTTTAATLCRMRATDREPSVRSMRCAWVRPGMPRK